MDEVLAAEDEEVAVGVPVDIDLEVSDDEDPSAGVQAVEVVLHSMGDAPSGALGDEERKRRSELAAVLHPNAFPAERDALIRVAEGERASQWMLDLLEQLPIDTRFDTVQDVWIAVGGHREERAGPSEDAPVADLNDDHASVERLEPLEDDGVGRPDRSMELVALGVVGWAFDCAFAVARAAVSLVRRSAASDA